MFERPHHRRVARVLEALDGPRLRELGCLFGSGTAIALRFGEYRESVDIDFLVSDLAAYSQLRQAMTGIDGLAAVTRVDATPLVQTGELRSTASARACRSMTSRSSSRSCSSPHGVAGTWQSG